MTFMRGFVFVFVFGGGGWQEGDLGFLKWFRKKKRDLISLNINK
jgi:hypothetical protein